MSLKCILLLCCLVAGLMPATGQYGFNQRLTFEGHDGLDLDDILFDDGGIVVRGNIWINTIQRWALFICRMDTAGVVEWHRIYTDPDGGNIVANSPTRFIKTSDGGYLLPVYFFNKNRDGVYKLRGGGEIEYAREYPNTEFALISNSIIEYNGFYYISGHHYRSGYDGDIMVRKISINGDEIWRKYYGMSFLSERSAGLILLDSSVLSIGGYIQPFNYFDLPFEQQWNIPWILFVDTSGMVVEEWKGHQNDPRTNAAAGLIRTRHDEWITFFNEDEYDPVKNVVLTRAAMSMMDSSYNLLWKKTVGSYNSIYNALRGGVYDSLRDEIIIAGQIGVVDRMKAYIAKLTTTGETKWEVYTNSRDDPSVQHRLTSVCLSPSGSAYAAGYMDYYDPYLKRDGWILKVTADGCVDTLCTTTSILDQIRPKGEVRVYPNPATDFISIVIEAGLQTNTLLTLYDLTGRIVMHRALQPGTNTVSVAEMTPGMIFYRIYTQREILAQGNFVKSD